MNKIDSLILLPMPRCVEVGTGTFVLPDALSMTLEGAECELGFSARWLCDAVNARTGLEWTWEKETHSLANKSSHEPHAPENGFLPPTSDGGVVLRVAPESELGPEGYELVIAPEGITVTGVSARGVFYGVATLIQLIEQARRELPCLTIHDAPDFPNRGIMLDISRDKVPTRETLFKLIDLFASWKINQLQLYIEHTFAYRNHTPVWEGWSPLTAEEVRELDAYCRERFIELVPNQNSFGHLHHWLKHPQYRALAECPEGYAKPYDWGTHPYSLTPSNSQTLDLLRELYDELLPNFSSRQFNVGCDETFDLGWGQSRAAVQERGGGIVYVEFLKKIHDEVRARGRTMQFWGDIISNYPELVPQLPKDVVVLEWGYEANHEFAAHCQKYADAGLAFYVCPGTSSWTSILGRANNALANIRRAAENGLRFGACGLLNTDWGDHGHWQYLPFSYLGFAYGAAVSWNYAANVALDVPRALDVFVFQDEAGVTGQVLYQLGNVYQSLGREYQYASGLGRAMLSSLEQIRRFKGQTGEGFANAIEVIGRAVQPLREARMKCDDAELVTDEITNAVRMARHAAARGQLAFELDPNCAAQAKQALDRDLQAIIREHRRLWLARNRPGGLDDSVCRLEVARRAY